jgi:3',5'-cyclic AMP phosphodiesterase CpdA
MYKNILINSDDSFDLIISPNQDYKILQLTDLHLGFGPLSKKTDRQVLDAIDVLIHKASPDLIVLTGDNIYPFLPKSGTLNNIKQIKKLMHFLDGYKIPYTMVFGNHDIEVGSKGSREDLAKILKTGTYSIFTEGKSDIYGTGNFIINLRHSNKELVSSFVMLDSNMYGKGWFFSGFDCIHNDQIDWCMNALNNLKKEKEDLKALTFFHMPLLEYKTAYEKMKLGDRSVVYNFGSIAETNDYFGVSKNKCDLFNRAIQNGVIKGMFCGHDHFNTISLTYQDIMLVYGMSLDFLAYKDIKNHYTQRGGTVITITPTGDFNVTPLPLGPVVSNFVRGSKNGFKN